MTFSGKLTVGILLLLCLTLSLGGAWTIDQNLQAALLSSQTQNTAFHQRERNSLEQALRADGAHSTATAAKAVQGMGGTIRARSGPHGGLAIEITLSKEEACNAENPDR